MYIIIFLERKYKKGDFKHSKTVVQLTGLITQILLSFSWKYHHCAKLLTDYFGGSVRDHYTSIDPVHMYLPV